jgi:hypothetical protein
MKVKSFKLPSFQFSKDIRVWVLIIFVFFTFCLGIGVCLSPQCTRENFMKYLESEHDQSKESFTDAENSEESANPECPDLLIKQGEQILLIHSKLPKSETNPQVFTSLHEYIDYVETQRESGLRCPVLFLQQEETTQGETVYRMREDPVNQQGGLPVIPVQTPSPTEPAKVLDSSRAGNKFNNDMYPGFDAHGTQIGVYNILDQIHDKTSTGNVSDNPMDTNWGGVIHSQSAVESGKYEDRIVGRPTGLPKVFP